MLFPNSEPNIIIKPEVLSCHNWSSVENVTDKDKIVNTGTLKIHISFSFTRIIITILKCTTNEVNECQPISVVEAHANSKVDAVLPLRSAFSFIYCGLLLSTLLYALHLSLNPRGSSELPLISSFICSHISFWAWCWYINHDWGPYFKQCSLSLPNKLKISQISVQPKIFSALFISRLVYIKSQQVVL